MILDDEELDLSMRQADVAIRLRQPTQPDLIQRRLFTVHMHLYAAPSYLKRFGTPKTVADLDNHRIVTFGEPVPGYLRDLNWLELAGRGSDNPRESSLKINNIFAVRNAVAKRQRHRRLAELHGRARVGAGAAAAGRTGAELRDVFCLSGRNEELGAGPRLQGLPAVESAELVLLTLNYHAARV